MSWPSRRRPERRRPARRRLALIVAAALAAGLLGVSAWRDDRAGDAARDSSRAVIRIRDGVMRYRVVYRLDDRAGDAGAVSTEEVIVERPYRSRRTLWEGTDMSAPPARVSVSDFGVLSVRTRDAPDFTVEAPPGPATGDLRLHGVLDVLVDQGRLVARSRKDVLGTDCQVFRTGEPIGTGRLVAPTADEWADVCVDTRGLVLEERWVVKGQLFQVRTAVELSDEPDVPAGVFRPFSAPVPVADGGGAVIAVDPSSRPDFTFWELPSPPAGFTHRGRYEVLSPSGERSPADPGRPGPPRSTVVDVYERAGDFVTITRGSSVGIESELAPRPHGQLHGIGELGRAELDVSVFGSLLRVRTDAVQFLTMRGTVAPDSLVALARELRASERGRLRPAPTTTHVSPPPNA